MYHKGSVMKLSVLRFIKNTVITALPFSRTIQNATPQFFRDMSVHSNAFHLPATLQNSCYINFELDKRQREKINNYIRAENEDFEIIPVSLFDDSDESKQKHMITVNMYDVDNFIHHRSQHKKSKTIQKLSTMINWMKNTGLNLDTTIIGQLQSYPKITMCDIKTYVRNKKTGECGTMILDYVSNIDFVDPINIYKSKQGSINFEIEGTHLKANVKSHVDKIQFYIETQQTSQSQKRLSSQFVTLHDKKYSRCGIYDTVLCDSSFYDSLVNCHFHRVHFNLYYNDMWFNDFDSAFYFPNDVNLFVKFWDNV